MQVIARAVHIPPFTVGDPAAPRSVRPGGGLGEKRAAHTAAYWPFNLGVCFDARKLTSPPYVGMNRW